MNSIPPRREMERAYRGRDRSYDGVFFLAVKTTGIFCRPSCPARKPQPRNVQYFATARDALFAGYRPCKRCRPVDVRGRAPARGRVHSSHDWCVLMFHYIYGLSSLAVKSRLAQQ